jgi:hypothetical protein
VIIPDFAKFEKELNFLPITNLESGLSRQLRGIEK